MRERRRQRRADRARRKDLRNRTRRKRRMNSAVGKAALTAALTLSAARHGSGETHLRRNVAGVVEAARLPALPDLAALEPTVLVPGRRWLRRSRNSPFDAHIQAAAQKHRVSTELLRAIIQVESGFQPRAVSRRGARGLMQLMPGTARDMGARNSLDPKQNIFAGARYLRFLLDAFDGNVTLAAAAYNAGPAVVQRYGGVPPYKETQDYVQRVHALLGLPPALAAEVPEIVEAVLAPLGADPEEPTGS